MGDPKRVASAALIGLAFVLSAGQAAALGESEAGFPNWAERVIQTWANRARADPSVDMAACGANCPEAACYKAATPVTYDRALNHAARFHADEMAKQGYFDHNSHCTVVANIKDIYPTPCDASASCACVGGTVACGAGGCTPWSSRVSLFGAGTSGEIIASSSDPDGAFYQWLFERYNSSACGYNQGPPTNGHRFHLLVTGPAAGFGVSGQAVGDFGSGPTTEAPSKLVSGSHYPRAGTVDVWANWYDGKGPQAALVNVDGQCTPLALKRGTETNGAYTAKLSAGAGCHRYFFLFKDGAGALVTYPTTGSLGIGPDGSCADWDATRPQTGAGCNCAPQCSGKSCGDDSCGGSCGTCGAGATCQSGACVGPASDAGPTGKDGGPTGRDAGNGSTTGTTDGGKDAGGREGGSAGATPAGDGDGTSGTSSPSACTCTTTGHGSRGEWPALLAIVGIVGFAARRAWGRRTGTTDSVVH